MARVVRAAELGRSVRSAASVRTRQPLARARVVIGNLGGDAPALLSILAEELNVASVERVEDATGLFERRIKVLLPKVGKRLGASTQRVMQAARDGNVELLPNGGVRVAGVELAATEIEVQAVPRQGQHVAEDDGLVVELDTSLTPALILEGDVRELTRAVQEARRSAGLTLDQRIDLVVTSASSLASHRDAIAAAVGASDIDLAAADLPKGEGWSLSAAPLSGGEAAFAIRQVS